ncbi:ribosome small subunit-dependent GTPase A [Paenibacillus chitinolyticus]|uniref:ribosome small subunit-dependent GTPase A n=1 Tax=Paenibacillus chitinolyticus TaxID=79263 RepID=UPI002DBF7A90|nr:ribosome small subunit-dependent GTPase A [Paenibacillus chitinolyticus]MEC0247281.1 ribosome small subunit-dependent GTPase A [Paenibacillus chitinolyticus]
MPQGLIVKALSGYYYVLPEGSRLGSDSLVQCRARGVFKKRGISPLVGDRIKYEATENGEGTVTEIDPRTSEMIRPPIANVDTAMLVFSVVEPDLNLQLLDKFLVHIENTGLHAAICLTKADLVDLADDTSEESAAESAEEGEAVPITDSSASAGLVAPSMPGWLTDAVELYRKIGYPVMLTSSRQGEGVDQVAEYLDGKISVFAGQSGVGKSSMLNAIVAGLDLQTNEISHRLGRGKHTTRHVELIPLAKGGYVADTPGFSQLDFVELEAEDLGSCFREFQSYAETCKFRGCLHLHEPGCKVRDAVEQGEIAASRYEHYLQFLQEMKEKKRRY